MTIEKQSSVGASTEKFSAPSFTNIEPLTSSRIESESSPSSATDTTNSGTVLDTGRDRAGAMSDRDFFKDMFGDSRTLLSNSSDATKQYLPKVEFLTVAELDDNPFDSKFNSVPKTKPNGEKVETTPSGTKPDATPDPAKPTADAPKGKEVDEKAKPATAEKDGEETFDPFDPKFNEVPAKKDTTPSTADGGTPTRVEAKPVPAAAQAPVSSNGEKPKLEDGKKPKDDFLTRAINDAATGLSKLPETALKEGTDAALALGSILFGKDQEAARIAGNAERGKVHADSQDAKYVKQWRGPTDNGPLAPPKEGEDPAKYTHVNSDKSSYTVTNGKISDFTTAPTKDYPDGVKYSGITYDPKGQMNGYTSFDKQHQRVGSPDANGFASWKSTDTKPAPGQRPTEAVWRGKPAVDADGFRNLMSDGTMNSRNMDGSLVTTKPQYSNNRMSGLETTTRLPDNTQVTQRGTFDSRTHKLNHDPVVNVKEADGPKKSQVKFEGNSDKGELVPQPKPEKGPGGDSMKFFSDVLSPGALDAMKDVESMSIQRTGKNSLSIQADLNNVFMPPPVGIRVNGLGPLGRVSATPNGGIVDNVSADISFTNDRVTANLDGIDGSASLTRHKRRGDRNIGSVATSTKAMTWDMNSNTMTARGSDGRLTKLGAQNFPAGSFNSRLLSSQSAEDSAKETLKSLDKQLNSATLRQVKPGVFEGTLDLQKKQFAVDAPLGVAANIYLDDNVNFTRSAEGLSFKPGEAQLGLQIGNGLESRRDIARVSNSTDKGLPVTKIEFHGKHKPMMIPQKSESGKPADARPEVKGTIEAPPTPTQRMETSRVESQKPVTAADSSVRTPHERDAAPRMIDQRPATSNGCVNNHFNQGSHRRGLFGRRR
jgi:hypothetical protein